MQPRNTKLTSRSCTLGPLQSRQEHFQPFAFMIVQSLSISCTVDIAIFL